MRIATGGFHIENCTFSPLPSTEADFQILRGAELLASYGFHSRFSDVEMVPLVRARALPGGSVVRPFYEAIKAEFLEGLERGGPWDGVFLDIHGAANVEGMDDAEADFVGAAREIVGRGCLIAASYDLHGNVSRKLMEQLDILSAYRTAPHVDIEETEERAYRLLVDCIRNGTRPCKAYIPLPILLTGEQTSTGWEPGAGLYSMIPTVIGGTVLDASVIVGYAWADEPRVAASVVALGTDAASVRGAAEALARRFWERRRQFAFGAPTDTIAGCVRTAMGSDKFPVLLSDSGDNITAGAPGDLTLVLEELLRAKAPDAIVAGIPDTAAVERCASAGVGREVELALGGKLDPIHGRPFRIRARVLSVHDPLWAFDTGTAAVRNRIAVVQIEGVRIIITEHRTPFFKISEFQQVGIEPAMHKIIAVKMGYLSPELQGLAAVSLLALSPGAVNQDLTKLPFRRIHRPIFPLEPDMTWADILAC
jgi:microcystin degradation protein MlrC